MQSKKLFFLIPALITLTGCGATAAKYQPLVDGDQNGYYQTDLTDCQELAETRSYLNDDVKTTALMTAALGAVIGGLEDGLGGAVVGSGLGAGSRAWETRTERKNIVIQCMTGRGHRVVG